MLTAAEMSYGALGQGFPVPRGQVCEPRCLQDSWVQDATSHPRGLLLAAPALSCPRRVTAGGKKRGSCKVFGQASPGPWCWAQHWTVAEPQAIGDLLRVC